MEKQVVARLLDGRLFKGATGDFHPGGESLTIRVSEGPWHGETVAIPMESLKALFFVKALGGNRAYREKKLLVPEKTPGRKVTVTFNDGETIRGTATGLNLNLAGFFLFPADANSNNKRIYINRAAVRHIRAEGDPGGRPPAD